MPGRQSHGGAPSKKPKVRNKAKKRALDAYSIASHQNPDNVKIRQSRLGTSEGGNRPGKRRRNVEDDDDEEDEEQNLKKQRKGPEKGRFDELELDAGSDSEGNEWKLGQVDSDDDSELNSDDAFGESDDERFDGFAFSGSSKKEKRKIKSRQKDVNLDEDDSEEDSDSELDEGDLGEGAIDLAAMLDATEEDEDEVPSSKKKQKARLELPQADDIEGSAFGEENDLQAASNDDEDDPQHTGGLTLADLEDSDEEADEDDASSEDESMSSAGENDEANPAKIATLHKVITGLPQKELSVRGSSKLLLTDDYDVKPKGILTLEELMSGPISKSERRRTGAAKSLAVPLAKRQQDRLDRSVAYDKTKETLNRWTDTVKHNRRAEHLMFPLPDNDVASAKANTLLVPTTASKPFNDLEATIQSILEESGLANKDGKDGEDRIREFEELETNKMSIEEVKERRQQLRMARELMFREEAKAKRVKKIKSKSYRRVHRKEREKQERLNKEALAEGGFEPEEDEIEAQDRRRATERMGQKHRGSKWAKANKETGRAAWDEDARAGITEMARRDEQLRKRVEGKAVRKDFDDGSEVSVSESEGDFSEDDDATEEQSIIQKLKTLGDDDSAELSGPGSRLANMPFMRKAAASKKIENNAMIEEMRREIAGEDSPDGDEYAEFGRRIFGPGSSKYQEEATASNQNEFEEPPVSDDEDGDLVKFRGVDNVSNSSKTQPGSKRPSRNSKGSLLSTSGTQPTVSTEGGAWSKVTTNSSSVNSAETNRRRHKRNDAIEIEELDLSKAAVMATQSTLKAPKKSATLNVSSDEDSDDDNAVQLPFAMRDHELIKRAFAGADVVGEFEAEKRQIIEDEDDKVVDETLPGWGSWTGDGLTKREKAQNKGKVLKTVQGIKEKNRKDAKLQSVIINEKRIKKNAKYLASSLPHPFETRQQYERSLRLPVGPEWSTKETFQDATKPRILLKQGIIAPMRKPLL